MTDEERQVRPHVNSHAEALRRVERALQGMRYGEVIVKVEGGKVIWVDRHERERVG